ncbi:tetratricopeptide repeat protein [Pedobacter sp. SYP-B3415]|uniref:tetratricopeptide repeat protein n=1 Tax=Pedobacter sp. SYP-B3415 TaxID=2496641 RepID=UPI00101CCC00|nr:tetratricopeptide repeat protein [Pedobacter sp. SYP-B3415]
MQIFLLIIALFLCKPVVAQTSEEAVAAAYYRQGEYQKALVIYEKLFTQQANPQLFEGYFNSLLKTKRYDDAEKLLKKKGRSTWSAADYSIALGRIYSETGNAEKSERVYNDLIAALPADENRIRDVANTFYRYESYDQVIRTLMHGRKVLKNEQLFTNELLSMYRFKKDKNMLAQEYVNALGDRPQLLPQAENVLASVFESKDDYRLLASALIAQLQKQPDNESYTRLLIWQYIQQKDYDAALRQLMAYDRRTKAEGQQLLNTAYNFAAEGAYDAAIKAYEYQISKGRENRYYLPARIELINTKYQKLKRDRQPPAAIEKLAAEYREILAAYGRTSQTLFALKHLADLQAHYLNQPDQAEETLESALQIPGIAQIEVGHLKLDLGDVYVLSNEPWEAVLTYEQVSKQFEGQDLGNEARYRSARLSFYQGNFTYAKSQADILKNATSQLVANDAMNLSLLISDHIQKPNDSSALKMFADAELLIFRNQGRAGMIKLDSIDIRFPGHNLRDAVLMTRARVMLEQNDVSSALASYKTLAADFPESIYADDALFNIASLYETKLDDREQAKTWYQRLITEAPGSMFIAEARKRYRILRGDLPPGNEGQPPSL